MTIQPYAAPPAELTEAHRRDMTIPTPMGINDPTGGRLIAWAEGLAAAHRIGSALAMTSFVPAHFRGKPEEAAAAILYGDELGLTPTQSLQGLYVIGGKPALYARLMVGLVQGHGHRVWTVAKSDESVTVSGVRRGEDKVHTETWDIPRATRAGYTTNKKYQTDPQAMLYARAASDVCRQIAADVLAGVGYTIEEMEMAGEVPDSQPNAPKPKAGTGVAALRAALTGETEPAAEPEPETSGGITSAQTKALHAAFGRVGMSDRTIRLDYCRRIIGREIGSSKDMTRAEASTVLDALAADAEIPAETLPGVES